MSLRTFPPSEMTSTSSLNEKTPLMRSISASNDALNRSASGRLQHLSSQRQQPSQIPSQNSFLPLVCVLLTVVLERIAYYGILANLLLFLINETQFNQSLSIGIVFGFTGLAWLMSTFGGIVGDSYSGRYNAVWGSLLVYIVGVGMIFSSALFSENHRTPKPYYHFLALFSLLLISIGEGAYKANVTAFGGDQLRGQEEQRYRRFFNWYYWVINIGSFTGFSAIAYVEQVGSFTAGFAILFGCIVLAAVTFCVCKSRYISHPPTGHIIRKIYDIIKEARQRKREEEDSTRYVDKVFSDTWGGGGGIVLCVSSNQSLPHLGILTPTILPKILAIPCITHSINMCSVMASLLRLPSGVMTSNQSPFHMDPQCPAPFHMDPQCPGSDLPGTYFR